MLKRQFHNRRVYPVHRLDRETSGVMLFAYHEEARNDLKSQFEAHTVDKTYYAIVEKQMPLGQGKWESYLEEDDFYYVKTASPGRGKLAITHYQILQSERNRSLLSIEASDGAKESNPSALQPGWTPDCRG